MLMGHTRIAFRSVTYAEKGKNVLARAGIRSKIIRLEPWETEGGCAFGLLLESAVDEGRLRRIMEGGGVRFSKIFPGS